jgi:hypothetical protein
MKSLVNSSTFIVQKIRSERLLNTLYKNSINKQEDFLNRTAGYFNNPLTKGLFPGF